MNLANEIWRLVRDIILVLTGVFIVILLALGKVPVAIAPTLVPLTFGLFVIPAWLRNDERRQREERDRAARTNGNGRPENGSRGD